MRVAELHNSQFAAVSVLVWRILEYTPHQHSNNTSNELYEQPQIHTACTTGCNVKQTLL
jgi:hypothetical protein